MRRHQAGVLALAFLAALDSRAPLFAITPVMPLVIRDLGLSFTLAGIVTGIPLLLMGLLSLPGGWLTDRVGARRALVLALACLLAASIGRTVAPNGWVLIVATVALGAAIGVVQPSLPRVARDTLPSNVPLASSIYFYGFILGGTGALAITPAFVIPRVGDNWRAVLLVWTVPVALALVGWLVIARRGPRGNPAAQLVSLAPLRAAFHTPGVPALTIAMGTQSAIFYAVAAWLPSYLTGRGWTLEQQAFPLAVFSLSGLVVGLVTGPLLAAVGYRWSIAISGAIIIIGMAPFLFWPDQTAWLCALVVSVGTTIAFGVCMAAPAELAPAERVGSTAGFMLAIAYCEATLGPFLLGVLRDLVGSFAVGWWLLLGMSVLLLSMSLGIPALARHQSASAGA